MQAQKKYTGEGSDPAAKLDREQILLRLRERILAFAASRIARDLAEDLAQDVLILLNEKYPQVTDLDELVPLSLQIARFKIMAQKRKAVRRGEYTQNEVNDLPLPDPGPDPAVQAERKEMTERLVRAMAQLGERCRELFRLKLEGLDFAEIQKRMGAGSINTVYTWDFRCRKNLLELMGGRWEAKP